MIDLKDGTSSRRISIRSQAKVIVAENMENKVEPYTMKPKKHGYRISQKISIERGAKSRCPKTVKKVY